MTRLPDFSVADRWVEESAPKERYGRHVGIELADAEVRLAPGSNGVTACPTRYGEAQGIELVIFNVATDRFRSQFYSSMREPFGTGRKFDDLAERACTTLKLQADHARERVGVTSDETCADLADRP